MAYIRAEPPCRVLTVTVAIGFLMNTLPKSNTWGERKLGVRGGTGGCYISSYLRYEQGEGTNGRREAMRGMEKVMRRQKLRDNMSLLGVYFFCSVVPH